MFGPSRREGKFLDFSFIGEVYRNYSAFETNLIKELHLRNGQYWGEGFELEKVYHHSFRKRPVYSISSTEEIWIYRPGKSNFAFFPQINEEQVLDRREVSYGIRKLVREGYHHFYAGSSPPKPEDLAERPPPEYLVLVEGREMLEIIMGYLGEYGKCIFCKARFISKML